MATRERQVAPRSPATDKVPASSAAGATQARGERIRQDLDALMGEIDEALAENAEEFVKNYVQRGGQ